MNEADTCRKYVVPLLQAAGWDNAPYSIAEQRFLHQSQRSDSSCRRENRPRQTEACPTTFCAIGPTSRIAVVEAKADYKTPGAGLAQAKDYAEILGLKFAYSTNGNGIVEFDFTHRDGAERRRVSQPRLTLWTRLNPAAPLAGTSEETLLAPFYPDAERPPRYYQQIAINRVVEAIMRGKHRVLITMATGTGKTVVAFQICWKLWSSRWNRTDEPSQAPEILFLADRNILVDDPKDKTFVAVRRRPPQD